MVTIDDKLVEDFSQEDYKQFFDRHFHTRKEYVCDHCHYSTACREKIDTRLELQHGENLF